MTEPRTHGPKASHSRSAWNHYLVKKGRASFWRPRFSVKEACERAGL